MKKSGRSNGTFLFQIADIRDGGSDRSLSLNKEALSVAAERLDVPNIATLNTTFHITRSGGSINVTGNLDAQLTRICVASLEEMNETVATDFNIDFILVDPEKQAALEGDISFDEDQPEPLYETEIDLADLAIQQLSLEMMPYPRKPDAVPLKDIADQPSLSPFASLKQ